MSSLLERPAPPADARLSYGSSEHQFGDLRLPHADGLRPLLLAVHGGYWRNRFDLSHMSHLCSRFASDGWVTWNVEYRRVGDEGGGWPGSVDDLDAALTFALAQAEAWRADTGRIVAVGFSAGGHLALCLAVRRPELRAVVSLAGVVDLRLAWGLNLSNGAVKEFLGGEPESYPEADPLQQPIPVVRQRLIHGPGDESVPIRLSRNYAEQKRLNGEDVELLEILGASHFDLVDPDSAAWPVVAGTIEDCIA